MLHANIIALRFIEGELLTSEVCGNKSSRPFFSCDLDRDLVTFIYELDPYSLEYTVCTNTNSLRQGFRKLSSDRHTYVHTDRQTRPKLILYITPHRGWSKKSPVCRNCAVLLLVVQLLMIDSTHITSRNIVGLRQ